MFSEGYKMNVFKIPRAMRAGLCVAALLGLPGLASATDLTNFKTVFDTDFATAGVGGMRGVGTGNITLAGVATGTVTEAYLYWHGPNRNQDNNANANVNFNGTDVTGTFLGVSSDNCWGFTNSLAYRADVTSLVTGSGTYSLANFVKNGADVNGVSLVVFHNDGDNTNNRDIVMFDGNDSNIANPFDAPGWNITLSNINYAMGNASAEFHVSDGQSFTDDALIANGTTLAPRGPVFDGNSTPSEGNGPSNGSLWDIKSFDVTSLLNPGLNNVNITTGQASDCLSCIMIAINLPAGAAPDQPNGPPPPPPPPTPVPEPSTLLLLGSGLIGLAGIRRRKVA